MGGAFDPIHFGHLVMAEQARQSLALDGVFFVPGFKPPHRNQAPAASFEDRLAMVRLAIEGNEYFSAGEIEKEIHGPGYTYALLNLLKEKFPGVAWTLLLGADNLAIFDSWYRPEEVMTSVTVAVANRTGFEPLASQNRWASRVRMFQMPPIGISSTIIRQAVKDGQSIQYLLPEDVRSYILDKRLYR